MSMSSKTASLVMLVVFLSAITTPCPKADLPSSNANPQAIIVTVARTKGRLKVELKSNPARADDVLRGLQILFDKHGPDYPVVALIDEANARTVDFSVVPGLAGKAQFRNIHTFIVDYQRRTMNELQFCSHQPISAVPTLKSVCGSSN